MRHSITISVGPRTFRIGSDWRAPVDSIAALYQNYGAAPPAVPHYTVRLEANWWGRRYIRPAVSIAGDYALPGAVPVILAHALLAAEMAMNLQMALGERQYLLLHAASLEKAGNALIITGESGAGKSTLSALLATRGWRFMGDEFALIDVGTGTAVPFPRPISLKNESIAVLQALAPAARFGPLLARTAKGDIRHLVPDAIALDAMRRAAPPALILFPRFGFPAAVRVIGAAEVFVRLTQASTNYVALGEPGYRALSRLVTTTPVRALDHDETDAGIAVVEQLWRDLA